jgi:hypothetical protein
MKASGDRNKTPATRKNRINRIKRKRQLAFVLAGLLYVLVAYSQNLQWNREYLTISDIHSNGYRLNNASDNTIKIKLFHYYRLDREYIIAPHSGINIVYPSVREFSRAEFTGFSLQIFYDLECYSKDLEQLNAIAGQRISSAQAKNDFKSFLRIAGGIAQTFGKGNWQVAGNVVTAIVDMWDIYDDAQENGLSEAIIQRIQNGLISGAIDAAVKNRYANTAVKSLQVLYDYKQKNRVNLTDLENLAVSLAVCVSNNSLFNYTIDYDALIRPVVDYDGDGITNRNDDCPRSYGLAKYRGCPKEEYRAKRRKEMKNAIRNVWIDFGYSYSNPGTAVFDNYDHIETELYRHAIYSNLTVPFLRHKYMDGRYGAFGLDVSYTCGVTESSELEFTATDRRTDLETGFYTDRIKIKEQSVSAGLSYNFVFRRTVLQPKFGIIAWSDKTPAIYKQKRYYADLTLRFANALFLGAKYQQNPDFTFAFQDQLLSFPAKSWYYYGGFSIRF